MNEKPFLETVIELFRGKEFKCPFCGTKFKLNQPQIYPHPNGLTSKKGGTYWLYYECPGCEYQWAYWKIASFLQEKSSKVDLSKAIRKGEGNVI